MTNEKPQLDIHKGAAVCANGDEYIVLEIEDLSHVIARNLVTRELRTLPISSLSAPPDQDGKTVVDRDLVGISQDDIDEAKRRLKLIKPLLIPNEYGASTAATIAKQEGIATSTIYSWRKTYQNYGTLSSLLPYRPEGGKGRARIKDPQLEEAMKSVIDTYYLTTQKPSVAKAYRLLQAACETKGLKTPNILTFRLRIKWRSRRAVVAAREGERAANMMFDANEGSLPDAQWPLAIILVDHTKLPVIIVDEESRKPIARPWVTFAIDADSRVVPGMYLSLDEPSAMSAGMCISHAILPKEKWLADRGMETISWPCWGVMGALHMDNAREFRGKMLQAACDEYTIDLHLRPIKKPHYGAYIERLMGTVSEELKDVPGTTFSSPHQKGEYDSDGNAIMTLTELERWLILFIAKYHNNVHSGIGMPPLVKYRQGLLGTKGKPGRGLPARRLDEEKVRIDFMPYEERTIQDYGVLWDVHYFADVLRPWINAMDPDHPTAKRAFRFRRDPRDISQLYFFEPNVKQYFHIPYRDLSLPPISIWEFQEAKKRARRERYKDVDEQVIFDFARKMREEVEAARAKTKTARRQHQKQVEHAKERKRSKAVLPKASGTPKPVAPPPGVPGYDPSNVTPDDGD